MLGNQVFHVLTEFRFDAGHAIAQSQALQGVTQQLADSANQAQYAFESFGVSLLTKFNLPFLGALEIIKESVSASDKLENTLIDLANLLGTVSKDPFPERLAEANNMIKQMTKSANEFALPVEEMLGTFKSLFALQEFRGHGTRGQSQAMNISRMFLKSAPTLGVDAGQAQFQLMRALQGQASLGDTLFVSLTRDTKAMAEFASSSQKWNALAPDARVKKLTQALTEFSSDTSVLNARVNTLRGQITLLKNNLVSFASTLVPIGNQIRLLFVGLLKKINRYLVTEGPAIFQNLAKALEPWLRDPKKLFAGIFQLQHAKSDLDKAGKGLMAMAGVMLANSILRFFGISILRVVGVGLGGMILASLGSFFLLITNLGKVFMVLNFLTKAISTVLAPLLLFYMIFQLFSRAIAYAKISFFEKLATQMPMLTEAFARFSRTLEVFDEGFDTIAKSLAPIFEFILYPAVSLFIGILSDLSKVIMLAVSGFQGLVFVIMEFLNQIKGAVTGKGFNRQALGQAFDEGVTSMIERIEGKIKGGEATAQSVVNIGEVNQKFEFKQEMEPDRIAFTVKDQLLKIAQNPTQAKGRAFAPGGAF